VRSKHDVQLVLIGCEVMREEVARDIPFVAHDALEHHRLQKAGAWRNRLSAPGERRTMVENGLGHFNGFPLSPTRGQSHCRGQEAEEIHSSRIGPDILKPYEQVDGFVFEEVCLANISR
jgi:hypothetical protein